MRTRISVFLITLSGLILEVGLTRIYSASIWYHFAFVAISVALLGWGLGGFTVHLWKQAQGRRQKAEGRNQEADGRRQTAGQTETTAGGTPAYPLSMNAAAVVALLYAAAIPLCLWLLVRYPFDMERLPLYFLAPLLPSFLAGMALSIVFDIHRAVAGSLYFWDLIGASIGAVAVTLLLHVFGGEAALLVAAIAPAVAAMLLAAGSEKSGAAEESGPPATAGGSDMMRRAVQVGAALGVVLAVVGVVATVKYGAFRVKPGTTKAMRNQMDATPGSHIVQTGWNAYSRIDCVEGLPNSFARLYIDSDAWTGIRGWDGNLDSVQDMKWSYRALPFRLTPNAETLIIGPGGGPDVVAALASGSKKVTAVEMNPLMLKFVRSYGARAGNLYDRPDVETVLSEGRNFISRTDRKFDIILLGFVDSWASVASGGLSLSENYLYTAEAMRAYYDHLSDNGILVVLRWEMDIPRLTSNAVATLGANEARQRVVVLMEKQANPNDYPQMLFMLRKQPFTTDQMAEMRGKWTQANPIIMPDGTAPPGLKEVLAGTKTMVQYDAESTRFVGAVWDDSPFYFAIEKPWRMPGAIAERMVKWLLGPSVGMLALFAVFGKRRVLDGAPKASSLPYVGSLVYFAALG